MKIIGLHWAWHLLYLSAFTSLGFWGENRLRQIDFLKNELEQVQQLTLPKIQDFCNYRRNEIMNGALAFPTPKHIELSSAAEQTAKLVEAFGAKCTLTRERLRNRTQPDQINWHADLLYGFYQLGDSLSVIYGSDSVLQARLERCLFSGYRAFPCEQLTSLLAASDTAGASRLCLNLHLRAELALLMKLENLRKNLRIVTIKFDALIPAISFSSCPRSGVPFEAEIYFAAYPRSIENVIMKVNGKPVLIEAGIGHYTKIFTRPGEQKLMVEIQMSNPLTGERKTYRKEFVVFVADLAEAR